MKRTFFSSIKRIFQVGVLALALVFGWVAVSVLRLIKGDDAWNKKQDKTVFGFPTASEFPTAHADVPVLSTPFLSIWDGMRFKIENDFCHGKPRSYFSGFEGGKREYETGRITPDLYKIKNSFLPRSDTFSFQIQEIEPEETFLGQFSLLRVVHPVLSEIFVNANFKSFHVFKKGDLLKNFIRPAGASNQNGENMAELAAPERLADDSKQEIFLEKNDFLMLDFKDVKPSSKNFLLVKSRYRDWVMGENKSLAAEPRFLIDRFLGSKMFSRAMIVLAAVFGAWTFRRASLINLSPLFLLDTSGGGGGGGGASGATAADCPSSGKCLKICFETKERLHSCIGVVEPRAWQPSAETVEIPPEAVSNSGELRLKVSATERHYVNFVGLLSGAEEVPYSIEYLSLVSARHRRLGRDVKNELLNPTGEYVRTVPGDVIDLEFEKPSQTPSKGEQESYLIRAAGFYTPLSPEGRRLAGNWEENLGDEAKERLASISSSRA